VDQKSEINFLAGEPPVGPSLPQVGILSPSGIALKRARRLIAQIALVGVVAASFGSLQGATSETTAAGITFFENRIRPQLVEHCHECHSATSKKLGGGLRLDSRPELLKGGDSGKAIDLTQPEKSRLLQAIRHADMDLAMPPPKGGKKKLPDAVIADFARWIQMGAPFPEKGASSSASAYTGNRHWSFQPIQDPAPPAIRDRSWPKTSIDDFVLAGMEAQGIHPAPATDRRTLLRRAAFDLTGLPPTVEDIDAFIADSSPDAYAKAVDRLLNSPHYGERWGRHWLDVVRYSDTAGETADYPVPTAWRYRNYVIEAFNSDKPYDEFLREQIAGDILARQGPRDRYAERIVATGYLAISRRFGFDSENYHHLTIQDTIDTLGQNVMGLSLGCARCHAHKYDPISTSDYYGLYGIFDSTRYAFPGSEQKQKHRSLVPLLPPEEAMPGWQVFEDQVSTLASKIQKQNQPVPAAVLSSLIDMDGDFEMQAVAAGGSNGVLVPPWVYQGSVAVTREAQSPYKNLHALGKVGASVAASTNTYRIAQTLYVRPLQPNDPVLYLNLDFRVSTNDISAGGSHHLRLGAQQKSASKAPSATVDSPALELSLGSDRVALKVGDRWETLRALRLGAWHNLQLRLDLKNRTVSGAIGLPEDRQEFSQRAFLHEWNGLFDFVEIGSGGEAVSTRFPGLEIDNLGVRETPIPVVSTTVPRLVSSGPDADPADLSRQLTLLAGLDGDFELQSDNTPPATPWGPGPNSVVQIRASSQSPFTHVYPPGQRGIQLPNSGAYNGLGQTLTNHWKATRTPRFYASFDFRCSSQDAGGEGSWRFYLGHGAGSSAAIELFFNAATFFRRSGDTRDAVRSLKLGEWYHVQLSMNLQEKSYQGIIASHADRVEFSGQLASGWDGGIDYTFVDSYGHLGGVKPALDVDNFFIGETPIPPLDGPTRSLTTEDRTRRSSKIAALRRQLAAANAETEAAKQELNRLLIQGPYELAYAVSEGTPRNSRIQLRGEPDKLSDEVPRSFIQVLGGKPLASEVRGSGRLELAQWLTDPKHPLTARVMVNRIWQQHFGKGLVKTPNDFGTRGLKPTHPELLDHLATQFMRTGWSIKAMHRLILLSATYQQAAISEEREEHYASFPRRRLSAEEIRDSILIVSGELDADPGTNHPFPSPTGWGYSQHGPFSAVYDHNKRSVYLMTQRIKRHPFLALFDGADPNASTPERRVTTVPTQALFFLNDPFVHAKAERLATRLSQSHTGDAQRIESGYRLTLGRRPTAAEQAEATAFLEAYRAEFSRSLKDNRDIAALAAYSRVLFSNNEFLHID